MNYPCRILLSLVPLTGLAAISMASPAVPSAPRTEAGVAWEFENYESTLASAKAARKPVLIYFWANGSESCAKLYSETMAKDSVVSAMSHFVCFSGDTSSTLGYELFQKYHMTTVPAFVFVDHEGRVDDAVLGYIDAEGLVGELARIREGRDTVRAFRERAAAAPEDFDAQYALAVKLQDCGDLEGHDAVTEAILRADPKGDHVVAARLHMSKLKASIVEAAAGENGEYAFESMDLAPVVKLAKKLKHEDVAFSAWNWIALVESERQDHGASRRARMAAWDHAADADVQPFAYNVARQFWEQRDELDRKEKKFFLKVAERAVELAEKGAGKATSGDASEGGGEAEACGAECADGEACGGCAEASAMRVAHRASANEALACALYVNGMRSSAVEQLRAAIALAPQNEAYGERLAMFESGK